MSSSDGTCASTNEVGLRLTTNEVGLTTNEVQLTTDEIQLTPNDFINPAIRTYVPVCPDAMKPKIKQEFETLDQGVNFYKAYAKICGFTARLGTTRRLRGETFELRNVLCNKQGKKEENKRKLGDLIVHNDTESSTSAQSRSRLITRTDCRARIQFKRLNSGTYYVSEFDEAHNHRLASPESAMFLKENRNMTSIQKTFVAKAARLKLGGVRAFRGWKELSGGYHNVGATEVDFKNFVRDMKNYVGDFDGQMFVENLIRNKETCRSFYFDFDVDENSRLSRLFWADPISIKNYLLFGEMVSVDSTFNTNKYRMIFVPFTGVDHHKRCITFAFGLIAHEDVESYEWLFRNFLEAMGGCYPKVMITDQDPAMKIAIENVLPETTHRLCMWHIMKKVREKVSPLIWQAKGFTERINSCVWNNYLEPKDFETEWDSIMVQYQLLGVKWFKDMYDIRESWIPGYFKDIFMGGLMRVTSRSESENSFFDRFVTSEVSLVEFWMCSVSAMDAQRHKQAKLNSDNKHSKPQRRTPLEIEFHASEVYTHSIFRDFQTELIAALFNCGMSEMQKRDGADIYTVTDTNYGSKTWQVDYSLENEDMTCTCCLFQRLGLLCRHILWLLRNKNAKEIPTKYIVHRWTKEAMNKPVFDRDGREIEICGILSDKKALTTELWEEVYSCVSTAEDNVEDMKYLLEKLRDLKVEMRQKRGNSSTKKDKDKEMEKYVGCSKPTEITIHPPKRSKTKGSGRRIESNVLKAIANKSKPTRYCKVCGISGHNSRTCAKAKGIEYVCILCL